MRYVRYILVGVLGLMWITACGASNCPDGQYRTNGLCPVQIPTAKVLTMAECRRLPAYVAYMRLVRATKSEAGSVAGPTECQIVARNDALELLLQTTIPEGQ